MRATRGAWATATAVGLTIALGGALPAQASPLDLFSFGGRSPGMAGTGVATATGYEASWLNPAGLADVRRKRVTVGFMYADMNLALNGEDTGTDPVRGLIFGGALPLPLGGPLRDRVGLALGFHVPPNAVNRARAPFPGQPMYALLETRGHVVGLQASAGYKVNEALRVGAGVRTLAALDGGIHVFTDRAGRFATRSEQELVTELTPIVGARLLIEAVDAQVGLVYRGEARTDYQIVITNDLLDSLPLTVPTLTVGGTSQFDPRSVALEVAWQKSRSLVVQGQVQYQDWSNYRLPTFNPVAETEPQEAPGFSDTFVTRLGAQWTAVRDRDKAVVVRGGYAFVPTPAPEMDGRQSLLDNHRHVLSAGLGLYLPGTRAPVHVDVWVQGHLLAPRRHTKDLDLYQPGEVAPFYTVLAEGSILSGGVTMGVDL